MIIFKVYVITFYYCELFNVCDHFKGYFLIQCVITFKTYVITFKAYAISYKVYVITLDHVKTN